MGFLRPFIASLLLSLFAATASLVAQSNSGELRLKVTDPSGLGVRSEVVLVSEASEFHKTLSTDDSGELTVKRLYEQHAIVTSDAPSVIPVGARLRIVPNHACTTTNLHRRALVVEDDEVLDAWTIGAAGPG